MLIRLYPNQITERWDVIGFAIENSMPPTLRDDINLMNNILIALIEEKLLCWIYFDKNEKKIKVIATTQILEDSVGKQKRLLIYSVYGFEDLSLLDWQGIIEVLKKYAKDKDCTSMSAYTDRRDLVRLAKGLGGESEFYISLFI